MPVTVLAPDAPTAPSASVTDEARLRELFDAHYRAIARYFRARGHSAADADDLVAATFEVAWRKLARVPAGDAALLWLYGVARNQSRNARRRSRRDAGLLDAVAPLVPRFAELAVEDRETFAETLRALDQLKAEDRDLILLVAWDELSPSEAGHVLGLTPSAARTRLHRARRRLAEVLAEGGAEPPARRRWIPSPRSRTGESS